MPIRSQLTHVEHRVTWESLGGQAGRAALETVGEGRGQSRARRK